MEDQDAGRFGDADRATHEPSPTSGLGRPVSVPSAAYSIEEIYAALDNEIRLHRRLLGNDRIDEVIRDHSVRVLKGLRDTIERKLRLSRLIEHLAQGIEARSDETPQVAQPSGESPVAKGDAPNLSSQPSTNTGEGE